jgi:hypothetical protein
MLVEVPARDTALVLETEDQQLRIQEVVVHPGLPRHNYRAAQAALVS